MGFAYAITDYLEVGIGSTKFNKMQDVNWKVRLLQQTRSGSIPVSVSYSGNAAVDVRSDIFPKFTNRLSYFHELLIARRFNSHFSLQLSPTYSHYNILDSAEFPELKHSNFGASMEARYKFSDKSSAIMEYAMPLTTPEAIKSNVGLGLEVATSGHAFQIFLCSYDSILGQRDYTFNINDFTKKDLLIGFNITRFGGFGN